MHPAKSVASIQRASFAILIASLLATFFEKALHAAPISFTGSDYVQNFDSLPSSLPATITKSDNRGPFELDSSFHAQFSSVTLTGWQGWKYPVVQNDNDDFNFVVSSGGLTTNGIYSFGSSGSTDRALGALAHQDTGSYRFGVILQNNTGTTIDHFHLEYYGEQWRKTNATAAKQLVFDFAIGDNLQNISATAPGGTSDYQLVTQLNFSKQVTGSAGGVNTTTDAYRIKVSHTVEDIEWEPNQTLILRWTDSSVVSGTNNPGLAIDDLKFSVDVAHAPEPPAIGLLGLAALGVAFRLRRRCASR